MKHTARRWLQGTAVALVLSLSAPAWAEIWGFVDKRGVSHFADHQVDRRYELFYRGAKAQAVSPTGQAPSAVNAASSRSPCGVRTKPGQTALQRMLRSRNSTAMARANMWQAPLVAS